MMTLAAQTPAKPSAGSSRVIIIGAGLGGLTTAVGLLQRGFQVRVYEQAPELKEMGAGLTLATTAMRVFHELGLWPKMAAIATRGVSVAFVHYATGELLHGEFDPEWSRHPDNPEQSAHAHRAAVHTTLVDAVRALDPKALVLNHRLAGVEQDANEVRAVFDNGEVAVGDILIGADGVQSAVYRSVFEWDNPATFTGVMAIRCLMPRNEAIAPYLTAGRAVNFVGHGRGFHRYGIDDGRVLNCVALAKTDAWTQEGWTHPCSRDEFMALYQDFHPDVRGLIAHAPTDSTFKWALRARAPLPTWSRGRVTLLGDAAHPMLPYLGQGATAAIEDALVLARALETHADHATAFAAYEADRLPRTAEQMRLSEQQGEALNRGPDRYKADRPDQADYRNTTPAARKFKGRPMNAMLPPPPSPSDDTLRFLAAPRCHLIGGEFVAGESEDLIHVENPARETDLAVIAPASLAQLDRAVAAARASLETGWGRFHGRERAAVLFRFADLVEANIERLAEIMTLDNGMGIGSSRAVVKYLVADLVRYYAGWATKISGEAFKPAVGSRTDLDFLVATLREPVGVVGAIVPWNAPAGMLSLKIAPSLAAGCTLVLKTAELAPLTGEVMAELMLEAGAPPGTLNILHGQGHTIGAAMAAHPGIDKITFTGSTAVGRSIVQAAQGNLKKVTLELGGKSPVVIFPDADMAVAIPAASMACYLSTGQACMAGSRLFVHEDVHDEVVEGVAKHAAGLTIGDGMRPDTVLGPLISARQKTRVEGYVQAGLEDGATLAFGGEPMRGTGHFVGPALFTGVTPNMRIAREEIFGPVLSVFKFRDEDALIRDINGLRYGLSGSVWTRDIQKGLRTAQRIDSGQVAINHHGAMSPETPFGGNKESGWGREFGREGLEPYLKTKAISMNLGVR